MGWSYVGLNSSPIFYSTWKLSLSSETFWTSVSSSVKWGWPNTKTKQNKKRLPEDQMIIHRKMILSWYIRHIVSTQTCGAQSIWNLLPAVFAEQGAETWLTYPVSYCSMKGRLAFQNLKGCHFLLQFPFLSWFLRSFSLCLFFSQPYNNLHHIILWFPMASLWPHILLALLHCESCTPSVIWWVCNSPSRA